MPAGTVIDQSSAEPPLIDGGVRTLVLKLYEPSSAIGVVGADALRKNTCATWTLLPSYCETMFSFSYSGYGSRLAGTYATRAFDTLKSTGSAADAFPGTGAGLVP